MTVQRVPSGHVPLTVHPWSSSATAPDVPGAGVVTPEQAGASSHAGAGTPLRLNSAEGLNPAAYLRHFDSIGSVKQVYLEQNKTQYLEAPTV